MYNLCASADKNKKDTYANIVLHVRTIYNNSK